MLSNFSTSSSLGLVLSGGGARGIAHIGVLQALVEAEISIHRIAGTSMGAIVGAFFAAGIPPMGMLEILKHDRRFIDRFSFKMSRGGLVNMSFLHEMLDEYIGRDDFRSLELPLTVAATNLNSGEPRLFSEGPLYQAVAASAALPIVFAPQYIEGQTYIDGGLTNNLPVNALRDTCEHVIGVHVNFQADLHTIEKSWEIAARCFSLAIYQTVLPQLGACDLLIEPPETRAFGLFDFGEVEALFETGYSAAQKLFRVSNHD